MPAAVQFGWSDQKHAHLELPVIYGSVLYMMAHLFIELWRPLFKNGGHAFLEIF
jgi:hypothetical protein